MSRRIQIITPENIEVTYELAGIGSRFVAALIDHLLQILCIIAIYYAAMLIAGAASPFGKLVSGTASGFIQAITGLIVFAIIFGYFALFELLWAGRSPGKRVTGLRVIRDGGYPIDPYSSIVRNLVRIVDFLPGVYGFGLASVFISSNYKRLGDYAAGTMVIKERSPSLLGEQQRLPASPAVEFFVRYVKNMDRLTTGEFQVINHFVHRRADLDLATQAYFALRLGYPIIQKLEIDAPIQVQLHYADLLEAIERKYAQEHGLLYASADLDPLPRV